ncbi:hypothetical protein PSTG_09398 [Puccinia striiformis f. sp. tritici PST-78]|uniref:Uncharacterized protein n=1 Tax=Puccinia striiformis f. sp. tritici PST-78 TaxID=1165861 RepID=A0A0L0VDA4_9BASI|nr:hypothetical protein PSTG_09398 [Puccinia striiformis f. sp. tritici PST-78]
MKIATKTIPQAKTLLGVDFITQRITLLAAKRAEYDARSKHPLHDGPSLSAGYGIRWNIKFQSWDAGFQARKVISKLIENKRDRQEPTILHPSFRLLIFKMWFPAHYNYTLDLVTNLFTTQTAEIATTASSKEPTLPFKKKHGPEVVDYFPDNTDHCQEFLILALLARDCLACSATLASVVRCLSAAADTCGHNWGSLAAKTIERCLGSHQWLIQGVEPDGPFDIAQGIINQAAEEKAPKKADETLVATTST